MNALCVWDCAARVCAWGVCVRARRLICCQPRSKVHFKPVVGSHGRRNGDARKGLLPTGDTVTPVCPPHGPGILPHVKPEWL